MPSQSRIQQKQDALQEQYNLLNEKIERLRLAYAIEASAAEQFELEKRIEQAEAERDALERQIEDLERELECRKRDVHDQTRYPPRRVPTWVIYGLFIIGAVVTLSELLGLVLKGLRFLGEFATNPTAVLGTVVAFTALIAATSGYVLLKKRRGTVPWRQRPPAFSARQRMLARIVLVANVAVTLALIFGVLRFDSYAQSVAEDQLGVAVAQFGEGVDMAASARGRELSAFVTRSLIREIDLLPGLAGNVTVIRGPLVRSKGEAREFTRENNVALVIWGWVSGKDTFVPSFTFGESPESEIGVDVPVWYEVEVCGDGNLELSETIARRTSGLIEYILGLIYLSQEDYPKAAAEFQRAITLTEEARREPSDKPPTIHEARTISRTLAIYHLVLGRALAAQGKPDLAWGEYEIAESCDSEYGPTYIGFGNVGYSEGRCQEALEWYQKAVGLVPRRKKASAFYARGNAHFCLEQYQAAATDYEQAIELAESDDSFLGLYHLVLGITLCRLRRFSEGIQEIQQALEFVEPGTVQEEAALTELEKCQPEPTIEPTPTPAPTSLFTPTPSPTPTPISTLFPTGTPTSFPTPIPGATVPELIAPAMGREFRNPITFRWRGSLKPGQAYQVTVRHVGSGYIVQSELSAAQSRTVDLPAEKYGEWRWTVSVVQNGRILATSPEWMFWFNPYSRPTPFPTSPPTPFPTPPSPPTSPPTRFPTARATPAPALPSTPSLGSTAGTARFRAHAAPAYHNGKRISARVRSKPAVPGKRARYLLSRIDSARAG